MADEIEPLFTLDGLLAKTPDAFKPIVAKYAAGLIAMTAEEFCDWVELLILGKDNAAWQHLLAKMPNAELLKTWQDMGKQCAAANEVNAQSIAVQKEATMAVLRVLLAAALAWVGL